MKRITVSIDDETYRRARIKAAEQGMSVPALVRCFLSDLTASECDTARLKHEERELRARIAAFRAGDRLSRTDTHRRGA
jgi:plasmid stability protein